MQNSSIKLCKATFSTTRQCASETGKNVSAVAQACSKDALVVARYVRFVPATALNALEITSSNVGAPLLGKTTEFFTLLTAVASFATATCHYSAASLRETLLNHVEALLGVVDRMDASAAGAQWATLKQNFSIFNEAKKTERRLCLDEIAIALYHVACIALQSRAYGIDFSDANLVRVTESLHTFVGRKWPLVAIKLKIFEVQ